MRLVHALLLGIALLMEAFILTRPLGAAAGEGLLPSVQRTVDRGSLVIAVIEGARPLMMANTPGNLGILDHSHYVKLLQETSPDSEPSLFQDMESLVAAVEAGDIVASLQGELPAKYYLSRHPEATIRLMFCDVPNLQHRVSIAVRRDGIDLLRWLDVYLAQRGIIIDLDTLLYRPERAVY